MKAGYFSAAIILILSLLSVPALLPAHAAESSSAESDEANYRVHDADIIALRNVTVIDGTATEPRPMQTIVIRDGWIAATGPNKSVEIPDEAEVLDLAGHTVIPGMVGTHNHTHMPGITFMPWTAPRMYLASGVTTIQTTGSAEPDNELALAKAIREGERIGPDIIASGPYFSGEGARPVMIIPRDREHIEQVIREWTEKGVQWFKVYRHVTPANLKDIIDIAHQYDTQVAGHLCSVTYTEAAKLGIDAIEHGFNHSYDLASGKTPAKCDGSRAFRDEVAIDSDAVCKVQGVMIENGVALSSTLAISEAQTPGRANADDRSLRAMSPEWRQRYDARQKRMKEKGDDWYYKPHWLQKSMAFDVAYYRAGGLLTAGLDPGLHNFPGYGDQRNFELLVEAGLTVPEAVQVASRNGARSLDLPDRGSIATGKRADLVVLKGDLVEDPSVIRNVAWVFKQGKGYDPRPMLEDVEGQVGIR